MKISAIVLTKNNEDILVGCLRSISFVDEILVVDSGSTDQTLTIAQQFGAVIVSATNIGHRQADQDDFAKQRNEAMQHAKNDWVLFVDSDERVSLQLRQDLEAIGTPTSQAYRFLRRNIFLGKEMRFGGWQSDYVTRLLHRPACTYINTLHEVPTVDGTVETLNGCLFHFSHRSIAANMYKTVHYAELQSDEMLAAKFPKINRRNLTWAILQHFWFRYVQKRGYRDGMEGFIEAVYQAFSQIFVIRAMLWEKQRGRTVNDIYQQLDQRLIDNNFDDHAIH